MKKGKEPATVKELKELCREKQVKGYSKWDKKKLLSECWNIRKKKITDEQKALSLGEKEHTTKLHQDVADLSSALAGMLWLLKNYRDKVCMPIKPTNLRSPAFGRYFCDFSLCWYSGVKKIQWTFAIKEESFWDTIKEWCETRFVVVPVYLIGGSARHFNYLIIDKTQKTVERFEPYGHVADDKTFKESEFDSKFESSATHAGYTYIKASQFCPKLGVQTREELQGAYKQVGDPIGFCAFWSLWYVDRRLKYPNLAPSELMKKLTKQLGNITNLKQFIRNFAQFIDNEKRRIVQKTRDYINANEWSTSRAVTEALLWEVMYGRPQIKNLK
jgi:hypothetical protein